LLALFGRIVLEHGGLELVERGKFVDRTIPKPRFLERFSVGALGVWAHPKEPRYLFARGLQAM
jgi:hypothetical protein